MPMVRPDGVHRGLLSVGDPLLTVMGNDVTPESPNRETDPQEDYQDPNLFDGVTVPANESVSGRV